MHVLRAFFLVVRDSSGIDRSAAVAARREIALRAPIRAGEPERSALDFALQSLEPLLVGILVLPVRRFQRARDDNLRAGVEINVVRIAVQVRGGELGSVLKRIPLAQNVACERELAVVVVAVVAAARPVFERGSRRSAAHIDGILCRPLLGDSLDYAGENNLCVYYRHDGAGKVGDRCRNRDILAGNRYRIDVFAEVDACDGKSLDVVLDISANRIEAENGRCADILRTASAGPVSGGRELAVSGRANPNAFPRRFRHGVAHVEDGRAGAIAADAIRGRRRVDKAKSPKHCFAHRSGEERIRSFRYRFRSLAEFEEHVPFAGNCERGAERDGAGTRRRKLERRSAVERDRPACRHAVRKDFQGSALDSRAFRVALGESGLPVVGIRHHKRSRACFAHGAGPAVAVDARAHGDGPAFADIDGQRYARGEKDAPVGCRTGIVDAEELEIGIARLDCGVGIETPGPVFDYRPDAARADD